MRTGRVSRPRPPVAAASAYTNPDATNPYAVRSTTENPYLPGDSYRYGDSYAVGSSPRGAGTSGAAAGSGGRGYGGGQPGGSQTAPFAAATLFGLPAENGRVRWPVGLRSLPPANETRALRQQLELVLYVVATQAAEGQANRVFTDFGLQAVRDLRQLLRRDGGDLSDRRYREAVRFLDRAERGFTRINRMATSPGGAYR